MVKKDLFGGWVYVSYKKLVWKLAGLHVHSLFERFEAESENLDVRATTRGARNGTVIRNERVLVVLEGWVGIFFVDNAFCWELLVIKSDLNGYDARVLDFIVFYDKLAIVVDLGFELICS